MLLSGITTSNPTQGSRAKPRTLAALLATSFFYWMSQYLYVPTLPDYIRLRTVSLAGVGVVLSMYGLWQAIVRVPLGIAVDKTGRGKTFLILGFVIGGVSAIALALGRSAGVLSFARSLSGVAAGTWVPLIVVFSALFPPEKAVLATSLLTFSGSLGRMIATSLTGFLNGIGGYSLPFYLGAASAVVCVLIIALTKVERQDVQQVSVRSILQIFARRDVLVPSIISTIMQFGSWAVTFGFMPILAGEIGAGPVQIGLLVGVSVCADMTGNLINTRLMRRQSSIGILYPSVIMFTAGIGVYAASSSIGLFFVAAVLMGIGNGLSYPTLMGLSIERVDHSHRTTAMGIHQSLYSMGMFAGPWIAGIVSGAAGIRATFGSTALFCFLACYPLIFLLGKFSGQRSRRDSSGGQ